MASNLIDKFKVQSDRVRYDSEHIYSDVDHFTTKVQRHPGTDEVTLVPSCTQYSFKTERRAPRLGVMLVGWGGNNGSTVTAGILSNKLGLSWRTKEGKHEANYIGSVTQSSVVHVGDDEFGNEMFIPLGKLVPMVNPSDIVLGGWDISACNLAQAMERAAVLDYDLQRQVAPHMEGLKPLPAVFSPDFVAANQMERADNIFVGTQQEQLERLRADIREFREREQLDKVIVLWSANTERFCEVIPGVHTTSAELLGAIKEGHKEVSPSTIYAVAAILEGCSYINGSPQNTLVPGVVELAEERGVFCGGDDFKSGQTKMKSVLVDFLVSAGIKPTSIVSYNHLGNNDGMNLSAPAQFRSKEISKANVVDDMVASNQLLYKPGEHPDHVVVIKYVPAVGDSKRALDEYTSEIFMGGKNTIVMHNTCEDSLLACPLIIDLVLVCEVCERIKMKRDGGEYESFHAVLSLLSYLLKAPMVPKGTPVVNALFKQRAAIENVFRACVGLPMEDNTMLEHRGRDAATTAARLRQGGHQRVRSKEAVEAPKEAEGVDSTQGVGAQTAVA